MCSWDSLTIGLQHKGNEWLISWPFHTLSLYSHPMGVGAKCSSYDHFQVVCISLSLLVLLPAARWRGFPGISSLRCGFLNQLCPAPSEHCDPFRDGTRLAVSFRYLTSKCACAAPAWFCPSQRPHGVAFWLNIPGLPSISPRLDHRGPCTCVVDVGLS